MVYHSHITTMSKQGHAHAPIIVPVTVLMGSRGSGKTALLKYILTGGSQSHKMKFVVIANGLNNKDELLEQPIHEAVLSKKIYEEEIKPVINGCYSCYLRPDIVRALKELYANVASFDGIIIETAGTTDPVPMIQTFLMDEEIQKMYKLDSVITVVDSNNIVDRLDEQRPEGIENEAVEQVVFADKIILNKMDLMNTTVEGNDAPQVAMIEARLRQLNSTAPILRASYGKIAPKELLHIGAFDLKQILDFQPPESLHKDQGYQQDDSSIVSVTCKLKGNVNMELMTQWIHRIIAEDGANLKRYKGVVAVKGKTEKLVFQGVGMLMMGSFEGAWKKGERRESRFLFTGKYLDVEYLKDGFKACLVSKEPPRFGIGARVLANCGRWKRGKVLKHWDEGNVYRIRLDTNDEVWAPLDIDQYVKRSI